MMRLKRSWYSSRGVVRATGPTVEAALDRSDASALADLQMHWDEAYTIGLDGDIWVARFHGSADELRAHTGTQLRDLIRTDYTYRQQARIGQGSDGSDAGGSDAGYRGPGNAELDDDDIDGPYGTLDEDAFEKDDSDGGEAADQRDRVAESADKPTSLPPHANFADIRGERMST
jgi:hypothetical protein